MGPESQKNLNKKRKKSENKNTAQPPQIDNFKFAVLADSEGVVKLPNGFL